MKVAVGGAGFVHHRWECRLPEKCDSPAPPVSERDFSINGPARPTRRSAASRF
jgi:hypothetical protein